MFSRNLLALCIWYHLTEYNVSSKSKRYSTSKHSSTKCVVLALSLKPRGSITSCARVREQVPTKVKLPIIFNLTSSNLQIIAS